MLLYRCMENYCLKGGVISSEPGRLLYDFDAHAVEPAPGESLQSFRRWSSGGPFQATKQRKLYIAI